MVNSFHLFLLQANSIENTGQDWRDIQRQSTQHFHFQPNIQNTHQLSLPLLHLWQWAIRVLTRTHSDGTRVHSLGWHARALTRMARACTHLDGMRVQSFGWLALAAWAAAPSARLKNAWRGGHLKAKKYNWFLLCCTAMASKLEDILPLAKRVNTT